MDDSAFATYVLNNAPRYEPATLEAIVKGLINHIASRRWGKPPDLEVGSHVEATIFGTTFQQYGTVTSLAEKSCVIENVGGTLSQRLLYSKHALRILDEFEWNRVSASLPSWYAQFDEEQAKKQEERDQDTFDAIAERAQSAKRPMVMQALNGPVEVYRGAFAHAYRPDHGSHEYGVIVDMTPKKVVFGNVGEFWDPRIWLAKYELYILDEREWEIVDRELRRRRTEYEQAKKAGTTSDLRDYGKVEIDLSLVPERTPT